MEEKERDVNNVIQHSNPTELYLRITRFAPANSIIRAAGYYSKVDFVKVLWIEEGNGGDGEGDGKDGERNGMSGGNNRGRLWYKTLELEGMTMESEEGCKELEKESKELEEESKDENIEQELVSKISGSADPKLPDIKLPDIKLPKLPTLPEYSWASGDVETYGIKEVMEWFEMREGEVRGKMREMEEMGKTHEAYEKCTAYERYLEYLEGERERIVREDG